MPFHENLPVVGFQQPDDQAQQNGLARTRGTRQKDHLAPINFETDICECRSVVETHAYVAEFNIREVIWHLGEPPREDIRLGEGGNGNLFDLGSSIFGLWPLAFGLWPLVFGLGVLFGYPETKVPQGQRSKIKSSSTDSRRPIILFLPPQCRRCGCPNLHWTKIQVDHLYRVGSAHRDGGVDHRNTVRSVRRWQ